jgi:glycosyltransferase involved in cell wall biosynthesis
VSSPAGAPPRDPAVRVLVLGSSINRACGVRDHATLLAAGLSAEGLDCSTLWLQREAGSLQAERSQLAGFTSSLAAELARARPDAVLLHYSVFAFSYKGLPLFVPRLMSELRRARVPVVAVLHEYVYPWLRSGARGAAWAVSQRAALIDVMRSISGALVTAPDRVQWLRSRPWLARRPLELAPVFSNLPAPSPARSHGREPGDRLGLFGYGYEGAAPQLVLDALAELRAARPAATLRLLGAPGPESAAGRMWGKLAREHGLADAVAFSGRLPAQELSDELAACDALLFVDLAGPSPRKGTLAGALASGRPVVAADGPRTWQALVQEQALRVVDPRPAPLARELAQLLADRDALEAQGAAGLAFYQREMSRAHSVRATLELLDCVRPAQAARTPARQPRPARS